MHILICLNMKKLWLALGSGLTKGFLVLCFSSLGVKVKSKHSKIFSLAEIQLSSSNCIVDLNGIFLQQKNNI